MPKNTRTRTRIVGLPNNYKYKDWLNSNLNVTEPTIDYFKFANTFDDSENCTNHHYVDLLKKLSTGQSNKLTRIATSAKKLYEARHNLKTDFGKQYKQYWEEKNDTNMTRTVQTRNLQTVLRLNELTNNEIIRLAEKAHNIDGSLDEAIIYSEPSDTEGDPEEERNDESDIVSFADVISQTANLASDEVSKLRILDLSSMVAVNILKAETSANQFESIINSTKIDPILMSTQADNLINTLNDTPLSIQQLRKTLYNHGFNENFDFVTNHDIGFMEVTIRYFLDLMSSPNNPLNTIMLERTAATYLIIYIVNQLFITNNDVVEVGWLEREFFSTNKTKFDGIIFKVGNKSVTAGLLEFSGGVNDKTSPLKYTKDVEKLYSNMIKVMVDIKTDKMFCLRCYGHQIYFEKLVDINGVMYRTVDINMEVPTTPRKLIAYINEIPKILAWKQALINHTLSLN